MNVGLRITQADRFPVTLEGLFEVEGPKGPVDAYEVRIEFSRDFPMVPPVVFDVGERLPRDIDRHVYSDGHACLEVWPVWLAQNPAATAVTVLNGPVRNFFLSQSYYEATGEWPFGEYSHGHEGQREALRDAVRADSTADKDLLWRVYGLLKPPRRQNACPCGSRRLYRKCHRAELMAVAQSLSQEGIWLITEMYLKILERA
jgi:hypothetical protein